MAALHHDLRHDGHVHRVDRERADLLRIEQVVVQHTRFVHLPGIGLAPHAGRIGIGEVLRPETVERRSRLGNDVDIRNPRIELESHVQGFVLVDRRARHDGPEQNIVLADPALGIGLRIVRTVRTALLLLRPGAFALVHDLDGQRPGPVGRAVDLDLRGADGHVARGLRQQHESVGIADALGHRAVDDLDRRPLRDGRSRQHVESLERRRLESIPVGFGVQGEFHAERLADGDRQRRVGFKSDLLGSGCREDRQHEECCQGYFCNKVSHHKTICLSIRTAPRTGRPLSPPAFADPAPHGQKPEPRGGARSAGIRTRLHAPSSESRLSNGHREGLVAARPEFRPDYLPDFIPYDGLFYNFTTQSFAR